MPLLNLLGTLHRAATGTTRQGRPARDQIVLAAATASGSAKIIVKAARRGPLRRAGTRAPGRGARGAGPGEGALRGPATAIAPSAVCVQPFRIRAASPRLSRSVISPASARREISAV